ncbi:MAG: hypothetical protein CM15mV50_420 [uncultured marine virus]|nr:MAG: hypothetical protein CM15mV50_420 [uncultured marine virus]
MNNMNTKNALSGGGGVTVVQNNNFALGGGATARAEGKPNFCNKNQVRRQY